MMMNFSINFPYFKYSQPTFPSFHWFLSDTNIFKNKMHPNVRDIDSGREKNTKS